MVGPVGGDDRRPAVARILGVDDEDRDALVLRGVGVGADGQPEVVGLVAAGGPHLLAVDDVVVAVAPSGGAERGQVGAGVRLAVADREVHVTGQDPRQEHVLLLLGAVADQRRPDGLQRDRRQVHVVVLRLVGEDRLLDLAEPVAAVLLRPADAHPAVGAHPLDQLLVRRTVPVPRALDRAGVGRVAELRGEPGEPLTQLRLQRALLVGELEVLAGGALDRHLRRQGVERVREVGAPARVADQRVGDVDAHAAVQVVAGAERRRRDPAHPVARDREVVGRREAVGDPPHGVVGGQVEGAAGDVDVGHLQRDRLELRQRAAELLTPLHVVRGEVPRPGQHSGRGDGETGGRHVAEVGRRPALERLRGRVLEEHGEGRGVGRRAGRQQGDARPLRVDQNDHLGVAVLGDHQQRRRRVGVGDRRLAAGHAAAGVRRPTGGPSLPRASRIAGVSTAPSAIAGSRSLRCVSVPWAARVRAEQHSVSQAGTRWAARPDSGAGPRSPRGRARRRRGPRGPGARSARPPARLPSPDRPRRSGRAPR